MHKTHFSLIIFLVCLTSCLKNKDKEQQAPTQEVDALSSDELRRVERKLDRAFSEEFEDTMYGPYYTSFKEFYNDRKGSRDYYNYLVQCSPGDFHGEFHFNEPTYNPIEATKNRIIKNLIRKPFHQTTHAYVGCSAGLCSLVFGTHLPNASEDETFKYYRTPGFLPSFQSQKMRIIYYRSEEKAFLSQYFSDGELTFSMGAYLKCERI